MLLGKNWGYYVESKEYFKNIIPLGIGLKVSSYCIGVKWICIFVPDEDQIKLHSFLIGTKWNCTQKF